MWASDYVAALSGTLAIEVGSAALLGYRSHVALRTVVLLNLMSHPLLSYLLWINSYAGFVDVNVSVAVLEVLVVFFEWGGLVYVLRDCPIKLFVLAAAMNASSFVIGMMLFPC